MILGTQKNRASAQVCRLCGIKRLCEVNLSSPETKKSGLLSRVNSHLTKKVIHIDIEDGLSKYICTHCEMVIKDFLKFCEQVKEAQIKLEKDKLTAKIDEESASTIRSKSCRTIDTIFQAVSDVEDIGSVLQGDLTVTNSMPDEVDAATVSIGPNRTIVCLICKAHIDAVENTTLHMVTHGIGTIVCSCHICGKEGDLKQFITGANASGKELADGSVWCSNGCFDVLRKKTDIPVITVSLPKKGHACDACPKTFRSRAHKSRHAVIHSGDKPFLCDVCGIGFSQIESLKLHNRTHEDSNPHKCNQCGQKFRYKISLRSHMFGQHGSSNSKHVCDRCGKLFATGYKLQRHYRQHTGEKPYECTHCRRLFSQTGNLRKHVKKVHKDEDAAKIFEAEVMELQLPATETEIAAQFVQSSTNLNDSVNSGSDFLESILEESVPSSSTSVTANQFVTLNPSHNLNIGTISSMASNASADVAYYAAPPSSDGTKLNRRKGLVEMFAKYAEGDLLYVAEPAVNPKKISLHPQGLTLPKFSSLQSGTSVSTSTRSRAVNKM